MSINPVQGIGPANEASSADASSRPRRPQPEDLAAPSAAPDPGTAPKPEVRIPQNVPQPTEMPQDEVQVHRDSETNGEIVIRYVDHSGEVILQVPSSEVLGVARAIAQDFQQEAKMRACAGGTEAQSEGGKIHGH